MDNIRGLLEFIEKSPSCYHVIRNMSQLLEANGFSELREECSWEVKEGGRYYVTRGDSSMIAFAVPDKEYANYQITASHSDSPSFKIKENPEMLTEFHYVELNVEKYGGMIYAPWFDRPLSVAGKVVVRDRDLSDENHIGKLQTKLVNIDRDLVMIPNVAIHMNRSMNDGYKYNAQKDMIPILGEESAKDTFMKLIAANVHSEPEDIMGMDLFLYNRQAGTVWGADNEFLSSPKLDDLQCAYATMKGFLNGVTEGRNKKSVSVCCVFDNEEVGSTTKQGADSTMLHDVLKRINSACGRNEEQYMMAVAQSFMLSADNAHAVHPHHQDKADPTNRPYMNKGIVIKFNANQKYTTDSVSAAVFRSICENAGVPCQTYVNRSDIAGGSTLGNIANAHVSLNTVDIGLAQLAMHSPYETCGSKDTDMMIAGVTEFYNTHIEKTGQGEYHLER